MPPKCNRCGTRYLKITVVEPGKEFVFECPCCGHAWWVDGKGEPIKKEKAPVSDATTFPCGCRFEGCGVKVWAKCPLHAAAPELRNLVEQFVDIIARGQGVVIPPEVAECARETLLHMRGKQDAK